LALVDALVSLPASAYECVVTALLIEIRSMYDLVLDEPQLRERCDRTLAAGERLVATGDPSMRSQLRALGQQWDEWEQSYEGGIDRGRGLGETYMTFLMYASEISGAPGFPHGATIGCITQPLDYFHPERHAPREGDDPVPGVTAMTALRWRTT
jgi:hypothetical protein